jgi:hypothetical protein
LPSHKGPARRSTEVSRGLRKADFRLLPSP